MRLRVRVLGLVGGALSAMMSPTAHAQPALVGDGLTQSSNVTGTQVSSLFSFMFNVTDLGGALNQHLAASSRLSSSTDTVTALDQISSSAANVGCLQVSTDGTTAWWSGTVFFQTPDARVDLAVNEQTLDDVRSGRYIVGGKIINDGQVGKRSLFLSGAAVPEVSLNAAGTVASVLPAILGKTGANYCNLRDGLFLAADYIQLNTIHTGALSQRSLCVAGRAPNTGEALCDIQWLDLNGSPLPGGVVANTPANLASPPRQSLYDLSGVVRVFAAGKVVIR